MGIHGLGKLIADVAPAAIKEVELKAYFGRRIAIDASMSLYQFLIAIRHQNNVMTNDAGETTSHIVGFFYRTCKLLEAGIKPIYVFDGKPPQLKSGELGKRKAARELAEKKLEEASAADVQKFEKRLVRVTRTHNEDVKKLLRFMGLPVIESPSEAEAQCAQLAKEGLVYGVATEDMDALTFGAPRVIRNLTSGTGEKVKEYELSKALSGLEVNFDQFIDLCILMGCDYCGSIKGIGPKKGLDLIRKFSTIENILITKYDIKEFVEDVEVVYRGRNDDGTRKEESDKSGEAENGEENVKTEVNCDLKKGPPEKEQLSSGNGSKAMKDETPFEKARSKIQEVVDREVKKWEGDDLENSGNEAIDDEDDSEDEEEVSKKKAKGKKEKSQKNEAANVPENWLFKGARILFQKPNVLAGQLTESDLRIHEVDEPGLIEFLVKEHAFSEERVLAALKRIKSFKQKSSQSRIDSFFKVMPKESSPKKPTTTSNTTKRKNDSAATREGKAGAAGKRGRKPK